MPTFRWSCKKVEGWITKSLVYGPLRAKSSLQFDYWVRIHSVITALLDSDTHNSNTFAECQSWRWFQQYPQIYVVFFLCWGFCVIYWRAQISEQYSIKYRAPPYKSRSKKCLLCLNEKTAIGLCDSDIIEYKVRAFEAVICFFCLLFKNSSLTNWCP